MGLSQSEQKFDDAFSDEEASEYTESPTRQSYRTHAVSSEYNILFAQNSHNFANDFFFQMFTDHSSPGGDLSDEDFCSNNGTHGFESLCISNNHMEFPQANQQQQQQQQQYARNRSGSWTFRR